MTASRSSPSTLPGRSLATRTTGIKRSEEAIVIQITLNSGRTVDRKRALYRAIAEKLEKDPGLRREDVMINLVEVPRENWSFGDGVMSYPPD